MELIKRGKNVPRRYRSTCGKCDSIWEADASEVEGFHRNESVIYTKVCGCCGDYGLRFEKINKSNDKGK